ncbi:Retrotransposon-derived protein PEG10 [Smittium culicis]|uniref:Retrotransposon-derived protein PEG10 n=1 Tax=Smittium culicis TaxID=133412 RepID=A0A1R1X7Q4_9FUNG|nr:Retrotransposon-derived protein PEG10 [Smittium culicis]
MNIPSASFNQSIDLEQEANFPQHGIPMFSSNDSENSDSCFSGKVKLPDPQKFDVQFQRIFSDPNVEINARGMIRKSRQGPRSVAEYAEEFRILGRDSGFDQLALVDQFLRVLNENVCRI